MENVFYYWILWGAWIIAVFLMKKSAKRTFLSFLLLTFIITGEMTAQVYPFTVSVPFVLTLLTGYYLFSKSPRKLYSFLSVMTMSAAYAAVHLVELFDPVWFAVDRFYVVTGLLSILANYLGKSIHERLGFLFVAIAHGDVLFYGILSRFYSGLAIGSYDYMNMAAVSLLAVCTWTGVEAAMAALNQTLQKAARGKQA
ncbi:hypothetical protein [Metabacillus sp. cB07]|uniref:YphA family membrane protein n=1 Tax=Metabacillus sp. cB07 TaxID=2806989 RepID=UPI00193A7650|nr:hypothetical protein [Metabacillus sp. cB07]